ncbi:hypothetical protein TUMEXPCC7403_17200 [Tumidithrix helvetica PCC 7403]
MEVTREKFKPFIQSKFEFLSVNQSPFSVVTPRIVDTIPNPHRRGYFFVQKSLNTKSKSC